MNNKPHGESVEDLFQQIQQRRFDSLIPVSIEPDLAAKLAILIRPRQDLYEPLLIGTASLPKQWYDWNIGFILPHLDLEWITDILESGRASLSKSEGIAWALGEIGSDDERIIDFLYFVCEECRDYDAWWCAAEALEKLGVCDATDLKKRTLRGNDWDNLGHCLDNLCQRPAVIGVLRLAKAENVHALIIPRCRALLGSGDTRTIQNAVWLLERLRVDDEETLSSLHKLYMAADDLSHTLRPRIVEAFGQIAGPSTRLLLEATLREARYYRTRAYAAIGLGKIGDTRSLQALERALDEEEDERVIGHIAEAIYAIRTSSKRVLNQLSRDSQWPENGMIVDQSNDWYANPEIYDKFSYAEDPLALSLRFALSQVPVGAVRIADLGTGTGRLATFAAETRPDILRVYAADVNDEMLGYLQRRLKFAHAMQKRVLLVRADLNHLPFAESSVDAVVSSWGFPSNMWNAELCLKQVREVRRILKPGGVLVTVGWDETFRDELSELWYRFIPEPDFRRESIEEWRKRRRSRIKSPRNCALTFVKRNMRVPLLFDNAKDAAQVLGHLFGFSAGEWVSQQQRCEFSIHVGITRDTTDQLDRVIAHN